MVPIENQSWDLEGSRRYINCELSSSLYPCIWIFDVHMLVITVLQQTVVRCMGEKEISQFILRRLPSRSQLWFSMESIILIILEIQNCCVRVRIKWNLRCKCLNIETLIQKNIPTYVHMVIRLYPTKRYILTRTLLCS